MGKVLKLILLFLTIWPLVYIVLLLNGTINSFPYNTGIIVHLASLAVTLSMTTFYLIELYHTRSIRRQSKIKWFILYLLTGPIGMAIYWKRFIW